jgi:release factor glutamine methyltransferase
MNRLALAAAVQRGRRALIEAGISPDDAERDAALLARGLTGWSAAEWLVRRHDVAPPDFPDRFFALIARRAAREPIAYITGEREFYGRPFTVTPQVLIPRPETELLVEVALAALPAGGRALDLCTGSGCIAVSLALGRPGAAVVATDLSEDALALARENAAALGAVVELATGDLWAAVHAGPPFDVVASNPPYIPAKELAGLPREVRREPCIALDGGEDGLAVLRRIVGGAPARLAPGGTLCLEMHESHAEVLPRLCLEAGFEKAAARRDLAGLPRLTVATMAGGRGPA